MKNSLLIVLLFCSIAANAQFVTGQKLITGNINLSNNKISYSNGDEGENGYASGTISLLRFTTPTLLKGFGISYNYNDNHNTISDIFYQNSIGAFYAVTKLQPLVKKFYLTYGGNLNGSYRFGKSGSAVNYSKIKGFGVGVSGSLGLLYQLTPRLILSGELSNLLMLQYYHDNSDNYTVTPTGITPSGTEKSNSIGLSTGLKGFNLNGLNLGISYLIKNK